MRERTASGIRSGRLWSVAGRQVRSICGNPARRVSATSSWASAPHPMTRGRPLSAGTASGDLRTALLNEHTSRLRGDCGVAAIGVGAHGLAELLVQRRATDEHDVVVPHAALLELLDDDLHVRHRGREEGGHPEDVRLVELQGRDELLGVRVDAEVGDLEAGALEHHRHEVLPMSWMSPLTVPITT